MVNLNVPTAQAQVVVLQTRNGKVPLLGYVFFFPMGATQSGVITQGLQHFTVFANRLRASDSVLEFSSRSTALALTMLSPLLMGSPAEIRRKIAEQVLQHAQFSTLVTMIENTLVADPENDLDAGVHPEIFRMAGSIIADIFNGLTTASTSVLTVGSSIKAQHLPTPSGLQEKPHIEDATGGKILFINPTFLYYVFAAYDYDALAHAQKKVLVGGSECTVYLIFSTERLCVVEPREFIWLRLPPGPGDPPQEEFDIADHRLAVRAIGIPSLPDVSALDPVALSALWFNGTTLIWDILDLATSIGPLQKGDLADFVSTLSDFGLGIDEATGILSALRGEDVSATLQSFVNWLLDETIDCLKDLRRKCLVKQVLGLVGKLTGQQIVLTGLKNYLVPLKILSFVLGAPDKINFANDLLWAMNNDSRLQFNLQKVHLQGQEAISPIPRAYIINPAQASISVVAPFSVAFDGNGKAVRGDGTDDPAASHAISQQATWIFESDQSEPCNQIPLTDNATVGVPIPHTYNRPGTYKATFIVTNGEGACDSETRTIVVTSSPAPAQSHPVAVIKANPTSGPPPLTVAFDGSGSSDPSPNATITSYAWDFGDTSIGNGVTVGHTYTNSGTFTATLTIRDSAGLTDTASVTITVSPNPPPLSTAAAIYVTRADPAPDGAILKLQDLHAGLFQTIASGLNEPEFIRCGPDGHLYATEITNRSTNEGRIVRFDQNGTERVVVLEERAGLRPGAVIFTPNGDLYFGTFKQGSTQGIWRIASAMQSDHSFNPPEQILQATGNSIDEADPFVLLTSGPFRGDLLIAEGPNGQGLPHGRVLRALAPNFTSFKEFIPAHNDEETGQPFLPGSLAINSQGDVFVADFTNGKVQRYGSDGTFKGTFAKVELANQIAIGTDDLVYVTNAEFPAGRVERGGLFVFDAEGKLLASAETPGHLKGVTVCALK